MKEKQRQQKLKCYCNTCLSKITSVKNNRYSDPNFFQNHYKILDGKFSNLRFTFLCLEIAGANLKLVSPNDVTASLYSST